MCGGDLEEMCVCVCVCEIEKQREKLLKERDRFSMVTRFHTICN